MENEDAKLEASTISGMTLTLYQGGNTAGQVEIWKKVVDLNDSAYNLGSIFTNLSSVPEYTTVDFALQHSVQNDTVNTVGFALISEAPHFDFNWNNNIFNDSSFRTSLSNFLNNNFVNTECEDAGDLFYCTVDDFSLQIYSDNTVTATNGAYTCTIDYDGESYCFS